MGKKRYRIVCGVNTLKIKTVYALFLEIPNPTDYVNIVSYYAGDC